MIRTLLFILLPLVARSQFTYTLDNSIPVNVNGNLITNPWAGGLNSAQINTMDMNGDDQADLVIFDKMATRMLTFIAAQQAYTYAPEYETLFPEEISSFVVLRDFNGDGRKDLFTFGQIGVLVFQNVTPPGQPLTWKKLQFYNPASQLKSEVLLTTGFSGKINLLPGTSDLPVFRDMDDDGDLDVLNMRFVSPGTAEYHKNFSIELYGTPDSLELVRQTTTWGEFTECSCGKIAFGTETCADIGGRVHHTGGKSLLAFDADHDGDQDLVFSEEECTSLYYMENQGDVNTPVLSGFSLFPADMPAALSQFPAAYLEDLDFDGKADLLVSPNMASRKEVDNNFQKSLWFYRNEGTHDLPDFHFVKNNFLQESMIDVGDLSTPAFLDYNHDGDEDLFIGSYANESGRGSIHYFENTGNPTSPSFTLVTDDFLNLSFQGIVNIKPQFADVDRNGSIDLAFSASSAQTGSTRLYYIPNSSTTGFTFEIPNTQVLDVPMNTPENVTLIDIDKDGWLDALRGTSEGSLQYWQNTGSNHFSLSNDSFLGLGQNPSRLYLSTTAADLDADGFEDLVVGDQSGNLSIYPAFQHDSNPIPVTGIVHDIYTQSYTERNLGGRVRSVVARLFGTDKPDIITGNSLGGLQVLKNDEGAPLSGSPEILIFPNPILSGFPLGIKSDRNATVDIFTSLGQRIGTTAFVPANQIISYPLQGLAAGLYIARFSYSTGSLGLRFIVK